jgi:NAD(P)-dependent dehydrogenase (short-subunit alcohol dehydrogenase family)
MDEQRDLEGLSALVTGATSGIGKAAAEELARHGAEAIVHGRDTARGAVVVGTITSGGVKARFAHADLSDPARLDDLAEQASAADILVNNAGRPWFGPTADLDAATFDALFSNSVRSAYLLTAALAPAMAARGSGSGIVNLDSMSGTAGCAGSAAYGASKAALSALTRAWAAEFSPAVVRVNAVAPGPSTPTGPTPR